ncbi:MAG: DnaD domain protein [Veillonellales bacterium]
MNYLTEINSFYDWLETNSISDSGIVLWHALMHICNKAGWITEFAVAISTLETKTGLKKGAIIRARQRLQQAGRIDFKSRAGQQSAIYTIIPFNDSLCSIKERKVERKPDTNWNANRTQSGTQTGPIIKLNETKLNKPVDAREKLISDIKALTNRPISSRDYQIIIGWLDDGVDSLVALEAIKKAIIQPADAPIIYADKIVIDWDKRGLKTIGDVLEFLKQEKKEKLSKREQDDAERRRLTEEYDRLTGQQAGGSVQSKLPSLCQY